MKRVIIFSLLLLMPLFLQAKILKRYSIQSGAVEYRISGSGSIMGMTTKTTGTKSFYFKNYGAVSVEEERKRDITTGLVAEDVKTHTLTKIDNITSYSVDFTRKMIVKGTDPIGSQYLASKKDMSDDSQKMLEGFGGKKVGNDKVLGYACEVWDVMGAKQCLYKGQIPLWIKVDIMGLKSKIVAVKAKFDVSIPAKRFILPKYPVEVSPMYVSEEESLRKMETFNELKPAMGAMIKKMQENPNMSEDEQEEMMQKVMIDAMGGEKAFIARQKKEILNEEGLPKQMRECVIKAQTLAALELCFPDEE